MSAIPGPHQAISGTLDNLSILDLRSLILANIFGAPANFDPLLDYTWTIASAGSGIMGFSADVFQIKTGLFTAEADGLFGVALDGNNLQITYMATAVPEASTVGFYLVLAAGGIFSHF